MSNIIEPKYDSDSLRIYRTAILKNYKLIREITNLKDMNDKILVETMTNSGKTFSFICDDDTDCIRIVMLGMISYAEGKDE
jgi:hypothetical protein